MAMIQSSPNRLVAVSTTHQLGSKLTASRSENTSANPMFGTLRRCRHLGRMGVQDANQPRGWRHAGGGETQRSSQVPDRPEAAGRVRRLSGRLDSTLMSSPVIDELEAFRVDANALDRWCQTESASRPAHDRRRSLRGRDVKPYQSNMTAPGHERTLADDGLRIG